MDYKRRASSLTPRFRNDPVKKFSLARSVVDARFTRGALRESSFKTRRVSATIRRAQFRYRRNDACDNESSWFSIISLSLSFLLGELVSRYLARNEHF